jgi:hypothetical protein
MWCIKTLNHVLLLVTKMPWKILDLLSINERDNSPRTNSHVVSSKGLVREAESIPSARMNNEMMRNNSCPSPESSIQMVLPRREGFDVAALW